MTGYGRLASTGGAGLALGGTVVQQTTLLAIAIGLVLAGTLMVRLSFRRNKSPLDI